MIDSDFQELGTYIFLKEKVLQLMERLDPGRRVYKVFDRTSEQACPVHLLQLFNDDEENRRRLDMLAAWPSSTMPKILDCEHRRGKIYVLLSWSMGPSLRNYLNAIRCGHMPPLRLRRQLSMIRRVARTVGYLSTTAEVLHGNLKPRTLQIDHEAGRIRFTDYGVQCIIDGQQERGDCPYSAPEGRFDHSAPRTIENFRHSDQFSLSAILYEVLTGQTPPMDPNALVPPSRFSRNGTSESSTRN
jgi:serine/threonine protein kinase